MTPVSKFDEAVPLVSGCTSGFLGMGCETDLLAATPFVLVTAFFAAFVGWPSFVAAALLAATMVYAALSGFFHGLAAMLIYAALSGGYVTHAAMLLWAALSDGYGGDACCDGNSLEFSSAATCYAA